MDKEIHNGLNYYNYVQQKREKKKFLQWVELTVEVKQK